MTGMKELGAALDSLKTSRKQTLTAHIPTSRSTLGKSPSDDELRESLRLAAKRRGTSYREIERRGSGIEADTNLSPYDTIIHAIKVPPFKLYGKVPFHNMEILIGDRAMLGGIYDAEKHIRYYNHPHTYDFSSYICSMNYKYMINIMIRQRQYDNIIPYSMRILTKGGSDGAHHTLVGIPWCSSCGMWLGSLFDKPMMFMDQDISRGVWERGGYTTSLSFVEEYNRLHGSKYCVICVTQERDYRDIPIRCPSCLDKKIALSNKCPCGAGRCSYHWDSKCAVCKKRSQEYENAKQTT